VRNDVFCKKVGDFSNLSVGLVDLVSSLYDQLLWPAHCNLGVNISDASEEISNAVLSTESHTLFLPQMAAFYRIRPFAPLDMNIISPLVLSSRNGIAA
jgi:hypothetical protein